jgi:hypothetical protein
MNYRNHPDELKSVVETYGEVVDSHLRHGRRYTLVLYSIPNGLSDPEHPEWGSWGGRYMPSDHTFRSAHYGDTRDEAVGKDGKTYVTNHASTWRWRKAYQYEIAARIQWQQKEKYEDASHPPVVQVNGSCDLRP